MHKVFVSLTVLLVIVGNTFLVIKYSDNKYTLPLWLQQLMGSGAVAAFGFGITNNTADVYSDKLGSTKPQIEALTLNIHAKSVGAKPNFPTPLAEELPLVGNACSKGRFGAEQQDKSYYVWTDSAGVQHFSDEPPKVDTDVSISIVGTYPPAQFITKFNGVPMGVSFQDKLSQRLGRLIHEFAQVLDVTTVREVALNFRFFTQLTEFDAYRKRVAPTTPARTGFYLHATNEMIILVNEEQTGLNTSIHEAVHAINRALFGSMARWLNEGLAQSLVTKTANVAVSLEKPSLSLDRLFNATDADWDGTLSGLLYQSSYAFINRLMNTIQGRETIARMLLSEQVNGCENLSSSDVSRMLGEFE